jgi:hypothetical protein
MGQVPDIHYSPGFNRPKISWLPAPHARQLPAIRLLIAVSRREPTSSDKGQKAPVILANRLTINKLPWFCETLS